MMPVVFHRGLCKTFNSVFLSVAKNLQVTICSCNGEILHFVQDDNLVLQRPLIVIFETLIQKNNKMSC